MPAARHESPHTISRRRLLATVPALALVVAGVGCGDGDEASDASSSGAGGFPLTIDHKYGSTTIPKQPTRVVSVGYQDHDTMLALGVKPLGVRDWWNDQPYATWTWATTKLGDARPVVLKSEELDIEAVAALQPDVIIGFYSGITEDEYTKLSKIAPTVTQPADFIDFGMPWREQTLGIGAALGKRAEAQQLIDDVDKRYARVRQDNPKFVGATASMAGSGNDGSFWAYAPDDPRGRLLRDLGFTINPEIAKLAGDSFTANISAERADLLDTDVLIWFVDAAADIPMLTTNAVFQQLDIVKRGHVIYVPWDSELAGALSFSSVLSLPFALDALVPDMQKSVAAT